MRPGTFDHTILDDCRTEGLTPPKTHWARRIETPPYYAYPVRPGITFTYLGTRVNKQARMLMKDGKPSANMFAAGEIMSGNVLGQGYAAGHGHDHRQRVRPHRGAGSGAGMRGTSGAHHSPRPALGEKKKGEAHVTTDFRCRFDHPAVGASVQAAEPISLRDMGSFHVGGRLVEISGKPVKEVTFTPGGVPAKVDPNGVYQVEQMYVQYFLPANEHGAYPASDVAWRRPDRRHLGNDARRARGLAELFPAQGLERLQLRCRRTRPRRLGAIS